MNDRGGQARRADGRLVACAIVAAMLAAGCSSRARGLLANTAWLTLGTAAIALPAGVILGTAVAKVEIRGRRVLMALVVGAVFVPLQAYAAAWQTLLGFEGWTTGAGPAGPWLDGWKGAIWVHGWAAAAWCGLFSAWSLAQVERPLEEQSLLDAAPLRVLVRVSLRRAPGGLLAGLLVTATCCAAEIAVTDLFRIRTFAEEVYTEAALGSLSGGLGTDESGARDDRRDLLLGSALHGVIGLAALLAAAPLLPRPADSDPQPTWRLSRRTNPRVATTIAWSAWAIVVVIVVIPAGALAWKAGLVSPRLGAATGPLAPTWSATKTLAMLLRVPRDHGEEIAWSLAVGGAAAIVAVVVSGVVSLAGRRRPALRSGGAVAIALLAAIPGPLVAVATIRMLAWPDDAPWVFLTDLYNDTPLAPLVVQAVRGLPLVGLLVWTQLSTVPADLLESAASEGASWWRRTLAVALPLRWPGLVGAALCGLAIASSEVSATLLVYPPGVTPLSVRMSQLLHYGVDDRVSALALTNLLGVVVATLAARVFLSGGR